MATARKPSPRNTQTKNESPSPASQVVGSDEEDFEDEDEEEEDQGDTAVKQKNGIDSRKAGESDGKKKAKRDIPDAKNKSSVRAGITGFSVGRVNRLLRSRKLASRISIKAAVYLTAVLEMLTDKLFDAIFQNKNRKKNTRISSKNIYSAIKFDPVFAKLVDATSVILPESGFGLPEPGSEMATRNEENAQKLEDEQDPKGISSRRAARERKKRIKSVMYAKATPNIAKEN